MKELVGQKSKFRPTSKALFFLISPYFLILFLIPSLTSISPITAFFLFFVFTSFFLFHHQFLGCDVLNEQNNTQTGSEEANANKRPSWETTGQLKHTHTQTSAWVYEQIQCNLCEMQHLKSILAPKNKTYIFVLLTFSFSPVPVCSISEFFSLRLRTRCFLIPFRLCSSLPVYASEDFPWSVPFILNGITWNSHCWSFFHPPIRP